MGANGVSQDAAVCWNGRHAQYKQAVTENNIYYSIILSCEFFGKGIKMDKYSRKVILVT